VLQPTIFTNQFAAMPSLHAGWNLLIGLSIVAAARPADEGRGRRPADGDDRHVVLNANHYILDVVVRRFPDDHVLVPGRAPVGPVSSNG
jgi:hypothetical protein